MTFTSTSGPSSRNLLRALCRRCRKSLRQGVRQTDADRYVKTYDSVGFATALLGFSYSGSRACGSFRSGCAMIARYVRPSAGAGSVSRNSTKCSTAARLSCGSR